MAVHHDLVPAVLGDPAEVDVPDDRPVGPHAHELLAGDQEPAVGQPVDRPAEAVARHRGVDLGRSVSDDLAVAVEIDRDDLARASVREPQPAVVPARRFDIGQPVQQDFGFRHGRQVRHQCLLRIWLRLVGQRGATILIDTLRPRSSDPRRARLAVAGTGSSRRGESRTRGRFTPRWARHVPCGAGGLMIGRCDLAAGSTPVVVRLPTLP
jgi:hypothetical protein